MVLESAFTTIDNAVVVKVFELNIAGAIYEVVGLNTGLVGNSLLVIPTSVGIAARKVVLSEVTIGLETPNVTPCLALVGVRSIVGMADNLVGIVPFVDLYLRVADTEAGVKTKVFGELLAPCERQFPTSCTKLTCVGIRCAGTYGRRNGVTRGQHVFGQTLIKFSGEGELVVEEAEVEARSEERRVGK